MSRRGHRESLVPMDFEYDNKSGPIDATSPFFTATTTPARSRELNPTAPSPFLGQGTPQLNRRPFAGTQSHLDSPTKNAFATPSRLRDTAANFPQSGSRPLPSIPQHVSPWLPRTPAADYDFSSGGETPNTPAHDSEQATPDTHMAGRMQLLMDSPSPKKPGRRHSFFRAIRNFGSPSPTKEKEDIKEIKTEVSRKHYAEKMENRVAKRRSTRSDRASKKKRIALSNGGGGGGGGDDDDDDDEPAPPQPATLSPPSTAQHTYSASIAGFFHWLEAHPGLPAVLSYYLQFTLNAILALSFVYILYLIWDSVTADIGIEASKHQSELMVEIAACVKNYRENRCEPDTRVPAMEMACGNWETCMGRDPRKLARASVTVKAFAHIINGFFEEFSYKSMIFLTILIFGGFNLSNWAFGLLRQQHQHSSQPPPPQHQQHQHPYDFPQTPHRIAPPAFLDTTAQWGPPQNTPYQAQAHGFLAGQPPPLLLHSQSTPVVPSYAAGLEGGREREADGGKTPSWRRGFR